MKTKIKNRIKVLLFFIIMLISLCHISFAGKNKEEETKKQEEVKEFYSKFVVSENTNEGVKVSIVKSDKYGDFQDEYVAVDLSIENLNRYADLEINVEAIENENFKIHSKNKKYNINAGSEENISFDYIYNEPTEKYDKKKKDTKNKNDIILKNDEEKATRSNIDERYTRDREKTNRDKLESKDKEIKENKSTIMMLAIVIIIVFVTFIVIYFIRRYIRTHEDFFNILLMMGISLIISICMIINKENVYAYNQQTFIVKTSYSHVYTCEVWHGGIAYTFRYRVSYKYVGDIPTYPEDQDSDGDGLIDNYEVYFMTDINNVDTDIDGISDYDEIYTIDTDPLKLDTDNNGKEDGEEDYDKDGLTNIEEVNLGTYMNEKDSDYEGLSDYDEVKIYHTDPLNEDTDGDGLSDYEEVMIARKLGIEDISSVDKTIKYDQTLSRDNIDTTLYKENIIQIKVSGDVYGLIDNHIEVRTRRNATLDNLDSILGKVAYIDNYYGEECKINVSFDISNYSLKREALKICTYESGQIKMLDTTLIDNNITANISKGYVFVLDINRYIDNILAYKKDNYK